MIFSATSRFEGRFVSRAMCQSGAVMRHLKFVLLGTMISQATATEHSGARECRL